MSRASPSAPTVSDICAPPLPPHPPGYGNLIGETTPLSTNPFDGPCAGEEGVVGSEHANPTDLTLPSAATSYGQPPTASDRQIATTRLTSSPTSPPRKSANRELSTVDTCNDQYEKTGCCGSPCCRRCADCCFRCTARCTRVLLVVPNVIFLLFGATLVGLGVWMRADRESQFYLQILQNVPAGPLAAVDQLPVAVIAVGSCVAILSFLGCCGACFESVCFLCLYALFLVLMILAEIAIGIVIAVMREQLLANITQTMQNQVRYYYNNTPQQPDGFQGVTAAPIAPYVFHLTNAWDKMHQEFKCCGAVGPEDFRYSAWYNLTGEIVPSSCCIDPSVELELERGLKYAERMKHCLQEVNKYLNWKRVSTFPFPEEPTFLTTQGCKQSFMDLVRRHFLTLIGVVCAVVVLQIVDFFFACVLMNWFRKKQAECPWYDDDEYE